MHRRTLLAALAIAACLPASAEAAKRDHLWATVNICDTEAHPDAMGVRASMPGNKTRQTLHLRFRAQYLEPDGSWAFVGREARSRWIRLGKARRWVRVEQGFTFEFNPPGEGRFYTLRGVVDFQWRVKKRRKGRKRTVVKRRERLATAARSHPVDQSDPPGFSADRCEIR